MRTILLLALPFLAMACQPAEPLAGAGRPETALTAGDLAGAYRVAAIDGASIDQPEAMTATITASRIGVQSGCIRFAYDYRLDGGTLATTSAPVASCRRALMPAEQAVQRALAGAAQVARASADGLTFTGAGGAVTLAAQ